MPSSCPPFRTRDASSCRSSCPHATTTLLTVTSYVAVCALLFTYPALFHIGDDAETDEYSLTSPSASDVLLDKLFGSGNGTD